MMKKRFSMLVVVCAAAAACVGGEDLEPQGPGARSFASESEAETSDEPAIDFTHDTGLDTAAAKLIGGKAIYQPECSESSHEIAQGSFSANGFTGHSPSNARNVAVNPADGMLYSVHTNANQDFEFRRTADGVNWTTVYTRWSSGATYDPALAFTDDGIAGLAVRTQSGYHAFRIDLVNSVELDSYVLLAGASASLSPPSIAASTDQFYVAFASESSNGTNRKVGVRRLIPGGGVSGFPTTAALALPLEFSGNGCSWANYENYYPAIAVGRRGPSNVPVDQQDELFVAVAARMNCTNGSLVGAPLWHGTVGLGMQLRSTQNEMFSIPAITGNFTWTPHGLSVDANDNGRVYVAHGLTSSALGSKVLLQTYQDDGTGTFDHDMVLLGGLPSSISVAAHPTDPDAFKVAWGNPIQFSEGSWSVSSSGGNLTSSTRTLTEPGSHRPPNAVYWSTCSQGRVCELTTTFGTASAPNNLRLMDELRCCDELCLPGPDPKG